jgi:inorganic pyrophosphatase
MGSLLTLPAFVDNDIFNVVVESPRGAGVKLKYDATLQVMSISRALPLGLVYPYDWGFIPSTQAADNDPVDALVLWDVATFPGVVIQCRAAGVIQIEQNKVNYQRDKRIRNDRVLAAPVSARRAQPALLDGDTRARDEIIEFLTAVTVLEGKDIRILEWGGPDEARRYIANAVTAVTV